MHIKSMNIKPAGMCIATMACLLLQGCGGDGYSGRTNSQAPSSLTTLQVLVIARSPSETAAPMAVNGGAVTIVNPNDEISEPIDINIY